MKNNCIQSTRYLPHSNSHRSYKGFLSNKIIGLSQNLFNKLQIHHQDTQNIKDNTLQLKQIKMNYDRQSCNDSLQSLCQKAYQITRNEQQKIQNAKKRRSKANRNNTFLTGTGIYEQSPKTLLNNQNLSQAPKIQFSQQQLFRNIQQQPQYDDLDEIRKMISETDKNIVDCKRKVFQTQKNIKSYVDSIEEQNNKLSKAGILVLSNKKQSRY